MQLAESTAHDKGTLEPEKSVSGGWYARFMERQPHLTLRRGDPIASVRMECTSKEIMEDYFALLKSTLTEHELLNKPNRIYNVDETGMPLDHRLPKVATSIGQKKVRTRTSGNKSQVTVIACVSATGHVIPPFVIFDAKMLNYEWTKGEVPGTMYGLSTTGWVDTHLFKKWLTNHLLKNAVAERPLLLILDGHGSHYQPELISYAKENGVVMFCLPPHTTHETQPLDTSVFKPLKQNWQEVCNRYVQANPGRVITKYSFSALLHEAWSKAMVPTVIMSGFRRSGIYPFNPAAVEYGVSTDESKKPTPKESSSESKASKGDNVGIRCRNFSTKTIKFSAEQEKRFQRRYEEGFNIPDPLYLEWLKINHPSDDQGDTEINAEADHELEEFIRERLEDDQEELSLVEIASDIDDDVPMSRKDPNLQSASIVQYSSSSEDNDGCPGPSHLPSAMGHEPSTEQDLTDNSDISISTSVSPESVIPAPEHEGELKYNLIQYVPVKSQRVSATGKRLAGARVLTSDECVQILKEREEKKQKELEEKSKRKAEREQKKKDREEAAKEKAEKRKEAIRKKAEEKQRAQSKRTRPSTRKAPTRRNTRQKEQDTLASMPSSSAVSAVSPVTEEQSHDHDAMPICSDDSSSNQCCVCFEFYDEEEESEWVQCACKRWLHEDC